MASIQELDKNSVWHEFFELCKIPHGSGNTEQIAQYLKRHAESHGFKATYFEDSGNVMIIKPADPGYESSPTICLQGHMDMVCTKSNSSQHNFEKDAIQPRIAEIDGKQCVTATQTTLGADDGLGVAACLALIFDKNIKSGKIEVLITKDEETTMFGVQHMKNENLTCKFLLNLDSEDCGVVTIGSAGGFCQEFKFNHLPTITDKNAKFATLSIKDMSGGHSGIDAVLYHGNAIKMMARLCQVGMKLGAGLRGFKGGAAHNAIAFDAKAMLAFQNEENYHKFIDEAKILADQIKHELKTTDPHMVIEIIEGFCCSCSGATCSADGSKCDELQPFVENKDAQKIIDLLDVVPSQVLRMSSDVHGLCESSINLGKMKFCAKNQENNAFLILARSSSNSYLPYIREQMESFARMSGVVTLTPPLDPYGGWQPDTSSKLLAIVRKNYAEVLKVEESKIKVEALHAGLECAEIMTKYPGQMEAVSVGPTIKHPHSDREYCVIDTVEPFYEMVKRTIEEIAQKKM